MTEIIDGEEYFCCNNKSIYNWVIIDGKMRLFKIPTAALCGECYKKINEKYGIEFDIILPYHFQNKNFELLIWKNHKEYKLIKQIYEKLNIEIIEMFQKNNNVNDVIDSFMNPEKIIWTNINYLCTLPKYWLENFELYDFFGKKDKKQGIFNGPDFIFKDIKNSLKIGLEIVSWKWNINNTIKNKDQVIKFAKTNIYNDKNEDEQLQQLKEIILNKSKKSNNYVKCDELYLGIVVSNTIFRYCCFKYYNWLQILFIWNIIK